MLGAMAIKNVSEPDAADLTLEPGASVPSSALRFWGVRTQWFFSAEAVRHRHRSLEWCEGRMTAIRFSSRQGAS
jgi:hypothetical protein